MNSIESQTGIFTALSAKGALLALTVAALSLSALGCTSRKQYAINEAILISERRQLEDEIYRTKFELRDALRENEQLRELLEKENPEASKKAQKQPTKSNRPSNDELFPGGDALRVDQSQTAPAYQSPADPDVYDASPSRGGSKLPDFAPAPAYNRMTQAERVNMERRALNATQARNMAQAQPQRLQRVPAMPQAQYGSRPQNVQAPAQPQDARALASQPRDAARTFGRQRPIAQATDLAMSDERGVVGQVSYEERAAVEPQESVAPGFVADEVDEDSWSPVGM